MAHPVVVLAQGLDWRNVWCTVCKLQPYQRQFIRGGEWKIGSFSATPFR